MIMTLILTKKTIYGNDLIYPACDKSKTFAKLIGKKTFSNLDLGYIAELGYSFIYEQ